MLCGAVTVRRGESGKLVYERAKKLPEWEDMGYRSDAFNRELARASAAAEQERIAELERRRAIEWENSPQAAERRRFFDLIDERTAGLRAEVKELREQVAELQQQPVAAA
jgi:hypothetical protein